MRRRARARRTGIVFIVLAVSVAGALTAVPTARAQSPTNDEVDAARRVALGRTYVASNVQATEASYDPTCEFSTIYKTIWFKYRARETRKIVAQVQPLSSFDVEMAVIEITPEGDSAVIACEDRGWEGEAEHEPLRVKEGNLYYFMVGNATLSQKGGKLAFDIHRPIRISPRPDEVSWTHSRDGNAVVTGLVRCSKNRRISVSATLSQKRTGTDTVADGSAAKDCRRDRSVPWKVRLERYQGPAFRAKGASLELEFVEDDDGVNIQRSTRTVLIRCTWIGTLGHDRKRATNGNDRLCGLHGGDVLIGRSGSDVLIGHDGNDRLVGGDGRDRLIGGDGSDALFGGPGRDLLKGNRGNDALDGGPARDLCRGGTGRDTQVACD